MLKKVLLTAILFVFLSLPNINTYADRNCLSLNSSDYSTFKEYCYKITDSFLDLRNKYNVNWVIDNHTATRILNHAKKALLYLPDSLANKNYYTHLKTSLERGFKYPDDSWVFTDIEKSIDNFLNKTHIKEITWKIDVYPASWNAPLTVTLRWDVKDPTWTKLETYNYTWWVLEKWVKKVIWNKNFMNYTFREEWNYSVFLDVTSNHKNKLWNTDVLSFSRQTNIEVKEKIASTVVRINGKTLWSKDELKFTPQESSYWLLIDATSSTPTSWTKFLETSWDFWNGVEKTYKWQPKIERVVYASPWNYEVSLKMKTNTWKIVERKFNLFIRNPIATISSSKTEWYLWDKFTFTATPSYKDANLTFSWEILDLKSDKIIFNNIASTFSYSFVEKWRYNVRLSVTSPSWEKDYDNKMIYINSRAPIAEFSYSVPNLNKPNTLFLDWTSSYDLDFSDDWKLKYNWIIDGDRVNLDTPNKEWSNWYYTFSSLWDHSVTLEVIDPDDIISQKKKKVSVNSLLSLDFHIFPIVSQVWSFAKFVADSPNASFFEWDFWDGIVVWQKDEKVTHKYKKSWIYTVNLTVKDENSKQNSFSKQMYVADAKNPYALINLKGVWQKDVWYKKEACDWKWAYIINRVDNVLFSAKDSIDVTGKNTWLTYSWKVGDSYYKTPTFSSRFDELWCFKVKLTVRSDKTWASSTAEKYIKVENIKPTLSSLDISVKDFETDPVVVEVKAVWAQDKDWVIQSYLWYYYTDTTQEPQDFRATKWNSTTFVLPKVSWNYYFVVILKDNNEDRINSEDISSRYFITLSWDNINTPIISLKANNTSVSVWEEVIFTADVENILTQNISKDSKFYWDFNWDWFYDKETVWSTVSYKYEKPGEMRVKLKVSHKGFSNTRTLLVNVSNVLNPKFSYISIWDQVIFFNETTGSVSKYLWDMWDSNILKKKKSFIYNYEDWKNVHIVKLKVDDGTKIKETSKKIIRNFSNFIKVKKAEISLFSNYDIVDDNIILDEETNNLYLYIKSNIDSVENYAIDYDISSDSDLNWADNDDKNNENEQSFYNWWPAKIRLNSSREQSIRVFLLWKDWDVLSSKVVKITKNYIEKDPIKSWDITFEWVPESVKEKFEKLKAKIEDFPKEYRLKSLEYLQRLKEEWNDNRAKTNIILEFEWYITESSLENSTEIINMLESLLVEDSSAWEKEIALKALKNLVPTEIECSEELEKELKEWEKCYNLIIKKLDAINENTNESENKILWAQILKTIGADKQMTNKNKTDFKAILQTLVYGWVSELPDEEFEKVTEGDSNQDTEGSSFSSIILTILKVVFYIIIWVWALIWLFFLWYKFLNKDKDKSFTEFVSEKTNSKDIEKDELSDFEEKPSFDPLSEFSEKKEEVTVNKEPEKPVSLDNFKNIDKKPLDNSAPDWLNIDKKPKTQEAKLEVKEKAVKPETKKETAPEKTDDSFKADENLLIDSWVPDWLKWTIDEEDKNKTKKEVKNEVKKEEKVDETKKEEVKNESKTKEKKAEKSNVLELEEEKQEAKKEEKQEAKKEPKLETKEELDEITKIPDDSDIVDEDIPDWLKWSLSAAEVEKEEKPQEKETKVEEKQETKPQEKEVKAEEKEKKVEKVEEKPIKKDSDKKQAVKKPAKAPETKPENKTKKTWNKKQETTENKKQEEKPFSDFDFQKPEKTKKRTTDKKTETKNNSDELWDDWMKVPDWLKTED